MNNNYKEPFLNNSCDQSASNVKYDSKDEDDEQKRNKRRSKNDNDGRNHRCPTCGKCYLSYPALYTHIKQKHNTNGVSGRGRGRPKKDTGDFQQDKIKFNPLNISYFGKDDRIGITTNLEYIIMEVFNQLYGEENIERNKQKRLRAYTRPDSHPLFHKVLENKNNPNPIVLDGESSKADEILAEYLVKMALHVNPEYFIKLFKFVTLFREYVNIANRDKIKIEMGDYTELLNAEDIPDVSNEFITEFLDSDTMDFGLTKDEAIDLTLNLCYWLYDNNFTCSKLSLINSN